MSYLVGTPNGHFLNDEMVLNMPLTLCCRLARPVRGEWPYLIAMITTSCVD